jgi:hypothetical protein
MAEPNTDRSAPQGEKQPGVQGADGRKDEPVRPVHRHPDKSDKGGPIAQDDQQSTGLGSGQS